MALLPFILHAYPVIGGLEASYVVQSGSMEPTYSPGDVIYVTDVPAENIEAGDVITFREGAVGAITTTHRVVEKTQGSSGEPRFITAGDANENRDAETRSPREIVGVVMFSVPLIGYVISFASTSLGTVALIIVPSFLFVVLEVRDLWREATSSEESKENLTEKNNG